jgi:hypothetical protein
MMHSAYRLAPGVSKGKVQLWQPVRQGLRLSARPPAEIVAVDPPDPGVTYILSGCWWHSGLRDELPQKPSTTVSRSELMQPALRLSARVLTGGIIAPTGAPSHPERQISHLKSDHRMGWCFLARLSDDAITAVLAAAGANLRTLLGLLRRGARELFHALRYTAEQLPLILIRWLETQTAGCQSPRPTRSAAAAYRAFSWTTNESQPRGEGSALTQTGCGLHSTNL